MTRYDLGILDTCVLIDQPEIPDEALPAAGAISMISLAELHAGVNSASDATVRAARLIRLREVSLAYDAFPFDEVAAQCFGEIWVHVQAAGRNPRPRTMDLLIAATAMANRIPLYTRNPADFKGLEQALTVIAV